LCARNGKRKLARNRVVGRLEAENYIPAFKTTAALYAVSDKVE
jgi:hypothetical protein